MLENKRERDRQRELGKTLPSLFTYPVTSLDSWKMLSLSLSLSFSLSLSLYIYIYIYTITLSVLIFMHLFFLGLILCFSLIFFLCYSLFLSQFLSLRELLSFSVNGLKAGLISYMVLICIYIYIQHRAIH